MGEKFCFIVFVVVACTRSKCQLWPAWSVVVVKGATRNKKPVCGVMLVAGTFYGHVYIDIEVKGDKRPSMVHWSI